MTQWIAAFFVTLFIILFFVEKRKNKKAKKNISDLRENQRKLTKQYLLSLSNFLFERHYLIQSDFHPFLDHDLFRIVGKVFENKSFILELLFQYKKGMFVSVSLRCEGGWFLYRPDQLEYVLDFVSEKMKERYALYVSSVDSDITR